MAGSAIAEEPPSKNVDVVSDKGIEKLLEPIREKQHVPGLVAGIVNRTGLKAVGAIGVRKAGAADPITVNDKCHIGSDAKAMTATHIALLVEQQKLSWQSTVGEVFPHLKAELHPDFHVVTLEQLLTHRAGIKDDSSFWQVGNGTVIEQRETLMKRVLAKPPVLGPAGRVHLSPADWAKFIALHLNGARGEPQLLKAESFRTLQSPPAGGDYALGWIVVPREWAGGKILIHSGSNTSWFATVAIAPEKEIAFFAIANLGGPNGQAACDAAIAALIGEALPPTR